MRRSSEKGDVIFVRRRRHILARSQQRLRRARGPAVPDGEVERRAPPRVAREDRARVHADERRDRVGVVPRALRQVERRVPVRVGTERGEAPDFYFLFFPRGRGYSRASPGRGCVQEPLVPGTRVPGIRAFAHRFGLLRLILGAHPHRLRDGFDRLRRRPVPRREVHRRRAVGVSNERRAGKRARHRDGRPRVEPAPGGVVKRQIAPRVRPRRGLRVGREDGEHRVGASRAARGGVKRRRAVIVGSRRRAGIRRYQRANNRRGRAEPRGDVERRVAGSLVRREGRGALLE